MPGNVWLRPPWVPDRIAHSIFPREVAVCGDLESDEPIRIDGMMEGNVRGTDVTVSRKATVKGGIRAGTVRIDGTVNGRIEAASVVVTRHARLIGEVSCGTLEVEPGASFAARCRVWPEEEDAAAAAVGPGKKAAPAAANP